MKTGRKSYIALLLVTLFLSVMALESCGGPKKAKRSHCVSKTKHNSMKSSTKFMMN